MLIVHFISSHSQNDADPWQANLFLCWNQPGEVQSLSRHHPNLPSSSHSLSTSRKVYQCHGDSLLFIICSSMNMSMLALILVLTLVLTLVVMFMLMSMLVSFFMSYCLLHTQQAGKCLMSLFSSIYRKRDCWAPFPLPNISHSLKSSPVHRVQSLPLSCTVVE